MADHDQSQDKGDFKGEPHVTPAAPMDAPAASEATAKAFGALPDVESPSVSPAVSAGVPVEDEKVEPQPEPEVIAPRYHSLRSLVPSSKSKFDDAPPFEEIKIDEKKPRFQMKLRHWRMVRLAAAIAIGIGTGAMAGALLTGGLTRDTQADVAALNEKKAMQQSMAQMAKELSTLKATVEASNKAALTQTANLDKKITGINERLKKEQAEVTGSISPPQTTPAAPPPAPAAAEVPMPKPAPRVASVNIVPPPSTRPSIVRDWSVRGAQNGYVYVQGARGEVYQVVPGAPLPGLGTVESIRRVDGRWVVTTPKGIIVSMHERRFFE